MSELALVLALFSAAASPAKAPATPDTTAATIELELVSDHTGRRNVRITRRDWPGNAWVLRLPEYLIIYRRPDRTHRPEVEARADGTVVIRGERKTHGAIEYEFLLSPGDSTIDITATVTNTGARPYDAAAHGLSCLLFRDASGFVDTTMTATRVLVGGAPTTIASLARHSDAPEDFHHNSQPLRERDRQWLQRIVGRAPVLVSGSLIVRSSPSGDRHVATAWDDALTVAYNFEPRLNCIHSNPRFGALRPGATETLHGRVYFFEGALDSLVETFERDFPQKGYGPVNR